MAKGDARERDDIETEKEEKERGEKIWREKEEKREKERGEGKKKERKKRAEQRELGGLERRKSDELEDLAP